MELLNRTARHKTVINNALKFIGVAIIFIGAALIWRASQLGKVHGVGVEKAVGIGKFNLILLSKQPVTDGNELVTFQFKLWLLIYLVLFLMAGITWGIHASNKIQKSVNNRSKV